MEENFEEYEERIVFEVDDEEMVEYIYTKMKEEDKMITKSRIRKVLNTQFDYFESMGMVEELDDYDEEEGEENG